MSRFARRIRAVMPTTATRVRLFLWLLFVAAFVLLYWTRASTWGSEFRGVAESSLVLGYALYLALGCVRGFTLIPAANLVLLAIPIFPPVPLLVLTLVGILVSSTSIYAFAGSLHLAEYFEAKHPAAVARVRAALARNPTTIVMVWSFFPLAPTDLICYVCGAMRISFRRFMLGVLVGEGAICALYIFGGRGLWNYARDLLGV
jgi:uncharacterized membrane protein YdjX (TVP38/TMEM64 family)